VLYSSQNQKYNLETKIFFLRTSLCRPTKQRNMKNKNTGKILLAVTTFGIVGGSLASAQTPQTTQTNTSSRTGMMQNLTDAQKAVMEKAKALFEAGKKDEAKTLLDQNGLKGPGGHGMGKGHGKGGQNRKAIEDAIVSGNFATFQSVASSSPLAKIDQATFNLLTPQFVAKKNAEDQIRSILKASGIAVPEPKTK
jgi:hypothetical protein